MRILVVEDERKTADYLRKGLGESGYLVEVALTGPDGQRLVQEQEFDLVILDVMLPGLNGWQLLPLIRRKSPVPVLFLTARDAVEDRVRGLELTSLHTTKFSPAGPMIFNGGSHEPGMGSARTGRDRFGRCAA